MLWILFLALLVAISVGFQGCDGKTAEEWKGRIIYQVPGGRYKPFSNREKRQSLCPTKTVRDKHWEKQTKTLKQINMHVKDHTSDCRERYEDRSSHD